MFRHRDLRLVLSAAVLGLSLTVPSVTHAGFVLTLDDTGVGVIEVIIADDAPIGTMTKKGMTTALDSSPGLGVISFAGAVGGFTTQLNSALSKPLAGNSANLARIDLQNTSTTYSGGGVGTLEIMVTDTDFMLPGGLSVVLSQRIAGENVGDSVEVIDGFLDEGNMEFGIAGGPLRSLGPMGPFASAPFEDDTSMLGAPLAGLFSMSQHIRVVHSNSMQVSQFATTMVAITIPEPSTLLISLLGISVVSISRRRFRK